LGLSFSLSGQEVKTIVNNVEYGVGANEIRFDGTGMREGMYYVKLQTSSVNLVRKMIKQR
jgi:hypothetical protein